MLSRSRTPTHARATAFLPAGYPTYLTAIEVRNTLENKGFNFEDFSNSLSACHAALKRMLADKEVEFAPEANGKPTYKRQLPRIPSPSEAGFFRGELSRAFYGEEGPSRLGLSWTKHVPMSGDPLFQLIGKNEDANPPGNPPEKQRIVSRRRRFSIRSEDGGNK